MTRLKRQRRNPKKKIKDTTQDDPEGIKSFFLDSGAHSLFNKYAHPDRVARSERYDFYETDAFWDYVDEYADFVKQHLHAIDYYVSVDVIHNPELSWEVLKYMEDEHGLDPVPVIHMNTSADWLIKHLDAGYDFIGLGGVALEGTRTRYISWADRMFDVICDNAQRIPCVRVHGFAMTAWDSLTRYPWWSVDSASWAKAGAFSAIMVPKKRNGIFTFEESPDYINISAAGGENKLKRSYQSGSLAEKEIVHEWLERIGIPLGSVDDDGEVKEWGVISHHAARKIANMKCFQELCDWLPEWPWPFTVTPQSSFGII